MIKCKLFILAIVFISVVSCDNNRVFDEYQTLPASVWKKDKTLTFVIPKLDSLQPYNLFINIRNNDDYEYSNLFLISEMKFPNGKIIKDTLEYQMAAPNGSWLGTGFSDLKESKLWYKEQVKFLEDGDYEISIQHAMRKNGEVYGVDELLGITEVGFRIEFAINH
ncbi:gliding motility lipoprotein GldH [Aquimarina hainanensis]|uniref:Gliding motility lipoprotein GldH n=1 Tax=Aquimarina hainanensis TaxID=1578017 RepID=A0ABW5N670_9FLAO